MESRTLYGTARLPGVPMRLLALTALACVVLSSPVAQAQTEAAKAQALKRYQEGVALHDRGREEEAYLQFTEAYAVVQTPPILFNLARTEQLTGRHVAASEHFKTYLAIPEHPRVTPALRAKAREYLTEISAMIGHVTIEAPSGASVTVDGKPIPPGATVVDVEPGPHSVGAKLGNDESFVTLTVVAGATVPARLSLSGPGVVPPVVVVPPVPRYSEVLPPPPPPPPVEGKEPYWTARRKVGLVITGVGVVGVIVGGVFGGLRGSETTSADNAKSMTPGGGSNRFACFTSTSSACTSLANALSANGSDAQYEDSFLIGGGVLVAIGLVTTFWPGRGSEPPMALRPMVAPHLAGLQWGVSF